MEGKFRKKIIKKNIKEIGKGIIGLRSSRELFWKIIDKLPKSKNIGKGANEKTINKINVLIFTFILKELNYHY